MFLISNSLKLLIVLPAYNEEKIIKTNVLKVLDFCKKNLSEIMKEIEPQAKLTGAIFYKIVIADNGSTDRTGQIGRELAKEHPEVEYLFIKEKGKGRAIRTAWQKYQADIYLFCDIDLPVDLEAIKTMIELMKEIQPLRINGPSASFLDEGEEVEPQPCDLVVGSRYISGAKMQRTVLRKFVSLFYRLLLRILFNLKVKDAPCGLKAVNKKVRDEIVPQLKNNGWFFDIELLILAQRARFRIKEIAVKWKDRSEPFGRGLIKIIKIIFEDIKEIIRLKIRIFVNFLFQK